MIDTDASQFRAGMLKTLGASEHSSMRMRIRTMMRLKRLRRAWGRREHRVYVQAGDRMAEKNLVMELVDQQFAPTDEIAPPGQTPAQCVGKVAACLRDETDSPFTNWPARWGRRLTGEAYLELLEWTIKKEQRGAEAERHADTDRVVVKGKTPSVSPRKKASP